MVPHTNGIPIGSAILQSTVQVVGITGVPNSTQTETAEHGTPVEIGRIYRMHATWPKVKVFYLISQRQFACIYLQQNSVQPDTKSTSSH